MSDEPVNKHATCIRCGVALDLMQHEVRGGPMHRACWLETLRHRWVGSGPGAKAVIESTAAEVSRC